ncbi:hypothetical protein GCM10023321_64160 [Pseudonocardia eucalypti]|uniref:Cytotoxic translational repressor of toxin-antitoxin stability system n=1 Tax=Pseudonocardia eucalypti TaxID=648755 RepID=A0ABP9QY11_9PSEU|nr:hypothetical protein [Pseudonocardia eucalypti]
MRDARGRTGTHHLTYELALPDGRVLRTGVSHPPNRTGYGAKLWKHILRDQLGVDEATFWACVQDGVAPDRGAPKAPPHALPAELVHLLLTRVGLTEAEVAGMSRAEAADRLHRHWTEGAEG